jgi:hypothetical protein
MRALKAVMATRKGSSEAEKWNDIWMLCFPGSVAPSPYLEMLVSQPKTETIPQEHRGSAAAEFYSSAKNEVLLDAMNFSQRISPVAEWEIAFPAFPYGANDKQNSFEFSDHTLSVIPKHVVESPESVVGSYDIHRTNNILRDAILDVHYDRVHNILKNSFDQVAIGEYEWISELRDLGLSADEIADELLEKSQQAPWIYSKINVPDVETKRHGYHLPGCLHSQKEDEEMSTESSGPSQALKRPEADCENPVRNTIGYLCGIGGVTPMPDGSPNLQFGSVLFENARSTAIVALLDREPDQVVPNILQHLEKAIGTLQQVGGCCDSFTFLARQESLVELGRIDPNQTPTLEPLLSHKYPEKALEGLDTQFLSSLAAQFFSLAFALYAQGHCEPFRPFFLDTPLQRILLIGNQIWGPSFNGPCILVSPVELSCFGEMIQRQVFAFQYFDSFERSKVFSDYNTKFDLKAFPEDLLDTWGPGDIITPKDDSQKLHAIYIGGGLITPTTESQKPLVLHWKRVSGENTTFSSTFPRSEKLIVGARVSINQGCTVTADTRIQMAYTCLKELGTFPSYWQVSERQLGLGLQAGQSAVGILNFAQTWVKRLGQTKKSEILARRSLSIADLEGPFAVQVSFCTGIARRVRLRELLADVLPTYAAALATEPRHWNELQRQHIVEILRYDDFADRLRSLGYELCKEFETLAFAVLFLLQDTGVDREHENFVVGCTSSKFAAHCVRIPIKRESFWAQILADSEEVATFAYVAPRCFETGVVRCRDPTEPWGNKTGLFWTAVSLCQDHSVQQRLTVPITNWPLQDAKSYHIGRSDRPLLVRVLRLNTQDEPELLVSMSKIEGPFLNRLSMKIRYNTRCRLRESRAIDYQYSMAESVVVTVDLRNSD